MKNLINHNGVFKWAEAPDKKIYRVSELKNCNIPPLFVLYNNQLFIYSTFDNDSISTSWVYKSDIKYIDFSNLRTSSSTPTLPTLLSTLTYNTTTKKVTVENSMEQLRNYFSANYNHWDDTSSETGGNSGTVR